VSGTQYADKHTEANVGCVEQLLQEFYSVAEGDKELTRLLDPVYVFATLSPAGIAAASAGAGGANAFPLAPGALPCSKTACACMCCICLRSCSVLTVRFCCVTVCGIVGVNGLPADWPAAVLHGKATAGGAGAMAVGGAGIIRYVSDWSQQLFQAKNAEAAGVFVGALTTWYGRPNIRCAIFSSSQAANLY
jgi:hypothetical protein